MLIDQIDEAIDNLQRALELHRGLGDVRAQARAFHELSEVLWCPGRVAEAAQAARRAVAVLAGVEPGRELAMAYSSVSRLRMNAEDFGGAVGWGARALDLAEALDEPDIFIHALTSVGTARWINGETKGREQLERSLALARNAGLDEHVARAEMHLIRVARRQREYKLAHHYLEPALRFVNDRGLELRRGYLLGYRAQMELDLGDWRQAVDTAALVLREPRRSRIPRILALTTIGRVRPAR